MNRRGNRPSAEGAATRFDQALALCRAAGFRRLTFRGDADFSQTEQLDRWNAAAVRFIFGYDARANLIRAADALPEDAWARLTRPPRYEVQTEPRQRPANVKAAVTVARAFRNLRLEREAVAVSLSTGGVCAALPDGRGAQRLPETGRWAAPYRRDKAAVLRMEFKTFVQAFILIPVQVVRTSRRLLFRLLSWNPWQAVFLRGLDQLSQPLRF